MILEMKLKENVHFEMLQIKTQALPLERALVYCKVKETYRIKTGYTAKDFTFPSGFISEYLFLVGSSNYLPEIREIIPLDYKEENGEFKKRPFPKEFEAYQKVDDWSKQDFLLEPLSLPQFLAGQMAQRIVRKVRELETVDSKKKETPNVPLDYKVESVKGHYVHPRDDKSIKEPSFQLDFRISQSQSKEAIPATLYDLSREIIKDVVEKYHFDDFNEIRLSKTSSKDLKVISKDAL
jgi:hypothetical protein